MSGATLGRTGDVPKWAGLGVSLIALVALGLSIGVVTIPLDQVMVALSGDDTARPSWTRIVMEFRVPRVIVCVAAGAALGIAGLLLQTLFNNPLADPWFLGLVHGSRLGVAAFVVLAGAMGRDILGTVGLLSHAGLAGGAALGALAITAALTVLAPRVDTVTLLLSGLLLGQLCEGLVSVVLHFGEESQARLFAGWNDGNFSGAGGSQIQLLAGVTTAAAVGSLGLAKQLNALSLGETYARSLGLPVRRVRGAGVLIAALLCGAVTSICGPITFLGILAPHLARALFVTADHRRLIPASALTGAVIASAADLVVHLPWETHVLHLNAMLGLMGAPVMLVLLLRFHRLR